MEFSVERNEEFKQIKLRSRNLVIRKTTIHTESVVNGRGEVVC